jgi:hypothetical protein
MGRTLVSGAIPYGWEKRTNGSAAALYTVDTLVSDGGSSVPELDVRHSRVLASVPTASDAIRHCSIARVLQACIAVTRSSLVHQTITFFMFLLHVDLFLWSSFRGRGFNRLFYLNLSLPTYHLPECLGRCVSLMDLTFVHSVCRAREQRR